MFLLGSHQSSPAGQLTLYHNDLAIWNNQIFIHSTHTIVSNKTIPKQSCGIQNKHVTLQWRYQKQKYWNSIHLSDLFIENNPKLLAPTIDGDNLYKVRSINTWAESTCVSHEGLNLKFCQGICQESPLLSSICSSRFPGVPKSLLVLIKNLHEIHHMNIWIS